MRIDVDVAGTTVFSAVDLTGTLHTNRTVGFDVRCWGELHLTALTLAERVDLPCEVSVICVRRSYKEGEEDEDECFIHIPTQFKSPPREIDSYTIHHNT